MWPWAADPTALSISFLISEINIITVVNAPAEELLWGRVCSKCSTWPTLNPHNALQNHSVINRYIVQMLQHREVKQLASGHTATTL